MWRLMKMAHYISASLSVFPLARKILHTSSVNASNPASTPPTRCVTHAENHEQQNTKTCNALCKAAPLHVSAGDWKMRPR